MTTALNYKFEKKFPMKKFVDFVFAMGDSTVIHRNGLNNWLECATSNYVRNKMQVTWPQFKRIMSNTTFYEQLVNHIATMENKHPTIFQAIASGNITTYGELQRLLTKHGYQPRKFGLVYRIFGKKKWTQCVYPKHIEDANPQAMAIADHEDDPRLIEAKKFLSGVHYDTKYEIKRVNAR